MAMDKLHEALGAALDEPQADTTQEAAPETAEAPQEPGAEPATEPGEPGAPTDTEAALTASERARGPDGKFTTAPPKPAATPPGPKPPQVGKPPAVALGQDAPAPRTMAPAAREHWANLPRPVKDAFLKVEGQAARAVNDAAQHRQTAERFTQAVQPFMPHLQAIGVAPEAAVRELFTMEYKLRTGSPAERTGLIAHLMERGGVSEALLAAHLQGQPPPQSAPQPPHDPRVDELLGHMRQAGQRRAEDANARAAEHLRAFEATGPEFLQDVADDMADLVASERRKGNTIDAAGLKRLYEKACLLNDDVRQIMDQRKAEEAKRAQQQKAAQARHAGGSIQSQPAPPGVRRSGMAGLYEALAKNLG
jgi:hypothetical protein